MQDSGAAARREPVNVSSRTKQKLAIANPQEEARDGKAPNSIAPIVLHDRINLANPHLEKIAFASRPVRRHRPDGALPRVRAKVSEISEAVNLRHAGGHASCVSFLLCREIGSDADIFFGAFLAS
jgi:hypothetical protein